MQAELPEVEENVPGAHGVHTEALRLPAYVPGEHGRQVVVEATYVPGEQVALRLLPV